MTKTQMAQTVIQALYGMRSLPAPDDRRVKKCARTTTLETLQYHYGKATKILADTEAMAILASTQKDA